MTSIVIANGPCYLDNGKGVILFPSRWDSGVNGRPLFHFYPYELATLSALLKREVDEGRLAATNIKFLDGNLEGWNGDFYTQKIVDCDPDVLVCELSALTYPTMTRVMRNVSHVAEIDGRQLRAILCGPMGSYDRERALADGWTDVVTGEYELDVLELLGGIVPPEARTEAGLINLDWLPWPEDTDTDRTRYREINHYIDYRSNDAIVQLYGATRGCPLSCNFCVVPIYYNGHGKSHRSHRTRNVQDVCDEIQYLSELYSNFKGCYFNEEAHNANVEWLTEFCHALIDRGLNKYQYDAMTGAWTYTRELVELMSKAGYRQIRFGVESTSEKVGRAIKKVIHRDVIENLLGWCKEFGIGCYITLQVGCYGSTEEIDLTTIADAKRWIRQGLVQKWQLSTSTPQPGTPFYDMCKRNGWLVTEDINQYDGVRAVVSFPEYPAHRIQKVRNECGL